MTTLPAVVLAHKQGIGLSAYRREHESRYQVRPYSPRYELRGVREQFRDGRWCTVWRAYRIGIEYPYCVYDVGKSTHPQAVADDLTAWLAGA